LLFINLVFRKKSSSLCIYLNGRDERFELQWSPMAISNSTLSLSWKPASGFSVIFSDRIMSEIVMRPEKRYALIVDHHIVPPPDINLRTDHEDEEYAYRCQ
jgi:hypothetical protein